MKTPLEMNAQLGLQHAGAGYEYYQYDNSEFMDYMAGNYDEELDRVPYNHNEDEEGVFERVPLLTDLMKTVLQTAKFPERVLKKLERAITHNHLNLSLLNLTIHDFTQYIIP